MSYRFSLITVLVLFVFVAASFACGGTTPDGLPFFKQPEEPSSGGPQVVFTADKTSIQPGECVNLNWSLQGEGFFGVELNGQTVNPSGQKQVCPSETTAYTLAVDIGTTMLNREVVVNVAGTGQPPAPGQPPPQSPPPQQSQPPSVGC